MIARMSKRSESARRAAKAKERERRLRRAARGTRSGASSSSDVRLGTGTAVIARDGEPLDLVCYNECAALLDPVGLLGLRARLGAMPSGRALVTFDERGEVEVADGSDESFAELLARRRDRFAARAG